MQRYSNWLVRVLASRTFFIFTLCLLAFQALWLALSYKYPMLWDEYYHFGLIQYYGHHLNPIIGSQPPSLDMYGNVARSPKYFYHYLMSFPFRLISLWIHNQAAQVIALRVVNIALFTGGLVAFRAAMLRMTKSRALVHFILFVLIMLPLSTLLAAEVTYDNMQFLLTGLVLYFALRFMQSKPLDIKWLLLTIGFGLMNSIVKYTFLPILVTVMLFLVVWCWRYGWARVWHQLKDSTLQLNRWLLAALLLLVLLMGALNIERFGGNLMRYHTITPDCPAVASEQRCLSFSPYKAEQAFKQQKQVWLETGSTVHIDRLPRFIVSIWVEQLYLQYFTTGTQLAPDIFVVTGQLWIPFVTMLVATAIAVVCFVWKAPRLLRRADVLLVLLCAAVLALALLLVDYAAYKETSFPIDIQGRYLLPVAPFVLLVGGLGVATAIRSRKVKAVLAGLVLIGLIWGGGLITHITQSQTDWYWNNRAVINTNHALHQVLWPITF
ncbi:MAG TPA: DUF2142 domain-containing protein [Candidatus Saccharimonadales bacterium]|nr:DUF2142 domain-containing protein [Candidatus Saccharimonadales bacterium]